MEDDYLGGNENPLDSGRYTFGAEGMRASNYDRFIVD